MSKNSELRKQLHRHPELSGEEKETSLFIRNHLQDLGIKEIHSTFSQHSLIAEIEGENPGKTVLFRAELDALPLQEKNSFHHKSKVNGVSHKCGHDGHITILLALAQKLVEDRPAKGKFLLLFQSAEETGEGAQSILESGFLDNYDIDHAIALHNVPGFPLGSVVCKDNTFTPSVESFSVDLQGETSHAGEPDKGINPANCIADIINYLNDLHVPENESEDYFVVAPIHINMGRKAYGTSAGNATIGYTIRTYEYDKFQSKKDQIDTKISEFADLHDLKAEIKWIEPFASNKNNSDVVAVIEKATKQVNLEYIKKVFPFDWGEDFGLFTQKYKGAMFGLGSGKNTPPLHDEQYDFPDELIEKGSSLFYQIAKDLST